MNKLSKKKLHFLNLKKNYPYLLFAIPAVIFIIVFCYVPLYGILIAFKDPEWYPGDPIFGNTIPWVGFKNFNTFFKDPVSSKTITNTLIICLYGFVIGFPLPIIVSLSLNATYSKKVSKVLSTIFISPHFISLVVAVGMLYSFFGQNGLVNNVREILGLERYGYFREAKGFRTLFVFSNNWQDFGWSSIIYLAALSSVNVEEHEAAIIDGASRFKRIVYIDFPSIAPIVSMMLILSMGGLLNCGYEKIWMMQTATNKEVSSIISTWVYERGIRNANYSLATAVGLFNSLVNIVLLILANTISKKVSGKSMY